MLLMENLLTTLYCLPVYQCFVLAVLLFLGSGNRSGHSRLIMGIFQLLLTFYFSFNLLYKLKAFSTIVEVYSLILPLILLFIPAFYLYILSVTTPLFRFKRKHLPHLLPALIILLMNSPFLFIPFELKLQYITHGYSTPSSGLSIRYLMFTYILGIYVICNLQLIFYLLKIVRVYRKHKQYIEDNYSNTENISLNWIRAFIIVFISFFILNNLLFIIGFNQQYFSQLFYIFSMLGITLFAGIQGLRQKELASEIISGIPDFISIQGPGIHAEVKNRESLPINGITETTLETVPRESGHETEVKLSGEPSTEGITEKYSGSSLSSVQKELLIRNLESLMDKEKIYTIDNLSVDHVAQRLGTNSKYISQIINEYYRKNFYLHINSYRVEEAKRLMMETANEKYSILGIAHMVGFVSKSTFNTAFKRITGITPSEFKKGNQGLAGS